MTKLETLADTLDAAIRTALIGSEFGGDVHVDVTIHYAPMVEGVDWYWYHDTHTGLRTFCVAKASRSEGPRTTTVSVFPTTTKLANETDQPF